MEFWGMFIIIVLVICIVGLLLRLLSLRASLGEIARELNDKLSTDTNTLISISSGDKAMRALAAEINRQLRSLRKERRSCSTATRSSKMPSRISPTTCARRCQLRLSPPTAATKPPAVTTVATAHAATATAPSAQCHHASPDRKTDGRIVG